MKLNEYFLPTSKEAPSEANVISHKLMLRAGMIRQSSAGIYSWLPLGYKVLKKIENIIRLEQNSVGCQEILMPTIQPADLWRESGRYDDYGKEMLRISDRNDRQMLYGPTNEELITDIFRSSIKSYRDLPKILYHIQWKFRDELRPRYGVMRGREFLMKDSYSFDIDYENARETYYKIFLCYLRTFHLLGLKAIPMKADPGPIGGDLSHEFVILAKNGESDVYYDKKLLDIDVTKTSSYTKNYENKSKTWTNLYAATDNMHDNDLFLKNVKKENQVKNKGIEVGHVFYFGTKYSNAMGASVINSNGENISVHMGSYGIGVSRLVGAIIEASHDDKGIIWPEIIAPFKVGLLNLKSGDTLCDRACDDIYERLMMLGIEVIYDNTDERPGVKFNNMDLIGIPYQVIIGPRGVKNGIYDIKVRSTGETFELSSDKILSFFSEK